MDSSYFIHDKERVIRNLVKSPDGKIVTLKGCKIHVPSEYFERGLAKLSTPPQILGIHCIVTEDKYYGVMLLPNFVSIAPTSIDKVLVDGNYFTVFSFEPGSVVYTESAIVKSTLAVSSVFDEMVSSARIPWYISYEMHPKVLSNLPTYTGLGAGRIRKINELMTSIVARDSKDLTVYFRSTLKTEEDKKKPPKWVKLRSVPFSATNTISKLGGSYFSIGITAALVNPSKRVEPMERLLRM